MFFAFPLESDQESIQGSPVKGRKPAAIIIPPAKKGRIKLSKDTGIILYKIITTCLSILSHLLPTGFPAPFCIILLQWAIILHPITTLSNYAYFLTILVIFFTVYIH